MRMFETSIMDEKSTEGAIVKILKNVLKHADTNPKYNIDRTISYELSTVSTRKRKKDKSHGGC